MIQNGANIAWHSTERKNKRKGMITSTIIHLLLLLLFFFIGLYHKEPPDPEQGVLINFGTVDEAAGDVQPTAKEPAAEAVEEVEEEVVEETEPVEEVPEEIPVEEVEEIETEEVPEEIVEEVETQDVDEAPAIEKPEEKVEEPVEEPKEEKPVEKEPVKETKEEEKEPVEEAKEPPKEKPAEKKEEPKPEVDDRAMFKGSEAEENKEGSDGNKQGSGDQGAEDGSPDSKNYDGDKSYGLGNEGVGYDLEGRSLMGIPPIKDQSQETGIVAVRIKVNRNGDVISASYTSKGSTTTDAHLIKLAEEAARKAKFNSDSNASEEQFGIITFTFKLR
ncbi:MAG: energy transducer TonB [Chitinophagales bacterium]